MSFIEGFVLFCSKLGSLSSYSLNRQFFVPNLNYISRVTIHDNFTFVFHALDVYNALFLLIILCNLPPWAHQHPSSDVPSVHSIIHPLLFLAVFSFLV